MKTLQLLLVLATIAVGVTACASKEKSYSTGQTYQSSSMSTAK